jgi:hypothetical protein
MSRRHRRADPDSSLLRKFAQTLTGQWMADQAGG